MLHVPVQPEVRREHNPHDCAVALQRIEIILLADVYREPAVVYAVGPVDDRLGNVRSCPSQHPVCVEEQALVVIPSLHVRVEAQLEEVLVLSHEHVLVQKTDLWVLGMEQHPAGAFPQDLLVILEPAELVRVRHASDEDEVRLQALFHQLAVNQRVGFHHVVVVSEDREVYALLGADLLRQLRKNGRIHRLDGKANEPQRQHSPLAVRRPMLSRVHAFGLY